MCGARGADSEPDAFFALAKVDGHESHQGGARISIGCPECGPEAELILARKIVCKRCGTVVLDLPDAPLPPAYQLDPVADQRGDHAGPDAAAATVAETTPCVYLPGQSDSVARGP